MASEPRAFFAIDEGAATVSAALIGRLAHRWRLIGSLAVPATVGVEPAVRLLLTRLEEADPGLAAALHIVGPNGSADMAERLPRLLSSTTPPQRMAVLAGSARALRPLADAALRTGWQVTPASPEETDPLAMTQLLLRRDVTAVLVGAGDPPGADERRALDELSAVVSAAFARRPELTVVLAGSMAEHVGRFESTGDRPGELLLGSPAEAGEPPGAGLRELLDGLRAPSDDSRRSIGRAVGTLADVLDRRVEVVEVGFDGGVWASAEPGVGGANAEPAVAIIADAGLVPADTDDDAVDRVLAWSTIRTDRHRLRDRLRELRLTPWGDIAGDGTRLRLAAARAALSRLIERARARETGAPPDLIVVAGGAWAVAPGPAIALSVADVVRRPSATGLAFDHGRLLGPIGAIPDAGERRTVVSDMVDDVLVPLGTVVSPGGVRPGKSAGRLIVHASAGSTELDLVPGGLELVDVPPGESAVADLQFRDTVRLGTRGRRFAVDVAGGLGGLLIDLRDVPLKLPDRPERRRELLEAWQESLWVTRDR